MEFLWRYYDLPPTLPWWDQRLKLQISEIQIQKQPQQKGLCFKVENFDSPGKQNQNQKTETQERMRAT